MKFKKPIASFDVESTGTDVVKDKIVELSVCIIEPDGNYNQQTFRFNPGIPSSPAALKVHKITDEEVQHEPKFADVAQELFETCFQGKDLHGYNVKKFDIPMLSEEFARVGITFPEPDTAIYDSMVICHKKNPRDLTSAFKHYTDRTLENAHSAEHDVAATVMIFDRQIAVDFDENITPEELAAFCTDPLAVDFQERLIRNDKGEICFNFGMHKGKPVHQEPKYANWMLKQDGFTTNTKNFLRQELGLTPPQPAPKKPDEVLHPASSADDEEMII